MAATKKETKPKAEKKVKTEKPAKAKLTLASSTQADAASAVEAPVSASKFAVHGPEETPPASVRASRSHTSQYPFKELAVGGWFEVETSADADLYANDEEFRKAKIEDLRTISNRLSGAVRRFTTRNEGYKFSVSTASNSVVVKRVEA